MLDPDGLTRNPRHRTYGSQARRRAAGRAEPLRGVVGECLRPMLSPRLATLHRDAFAFNQPLETTVRLAAHRAESDLADLDLREEDTAAA